MAPQSCRATECVSLYFSDWYAAPYCYNPECSPQYIFISTSMSKIGQAKPKCQPLFQGVTKFRPHLCIQWLKMVPRQHFWAEAQNRLCIFTSCIFSHYVMLFLHNLLSHSPLSNPVAPFFFFLLLQSQISMRSFLRVFNF